MKWKDRKLGEKQEIGTATDSEVAEMDALLAFIRETQKPVSGAYNQDDASGFLRIQGLPGRVQGKLRPRKF